MKNRYTKELICIIMSVIVFTYPHSSLMGATTSELGKQGAVIYDLTLGFEPVDSLAHENVDRFSDEERASIEDATEGAASEKVLEYNDRIYIKNYIPSIFEVVKTDNYAEIKQDNMGIYIEWKLDSLDDLDNREYNLSLRSICNSLDKEQVNTNLDISGVYLSDGTMIQKVISSLVDMRIGEENRLDTSDKTLYEGYPGLEVNIEDNIDKLDEQLDNSMKAPKIMNQHTDMQTMVGECPDMDKGRNETKNISAMVPMWVCMYGFSDDGKVITPEDYGIKNMGDTPIMVKKIDVKPKGGWNFRNNSGELKEREIYMEINNRCIYKDTFIDNNDRDIWRIRGNSFFPLNIKAVIGKNKNDGTKEKKVLTLCYTVEACC